MPNNTLFTIAATYTLDRTLQSILQGCSIGKYPIQFSVQKNAIVTSKGNHYAIPSDPMDLCNLIHDIINGLEKTQKTVTVGSTESSRKSSRTMGSTMGVSDDAIYSFAKREAKKLGMDEYYMEELRSCIFTGIMLGSLSPRDFELENDKIMHIKHLDTTALTIMDKK